MISSEKEEVVYIVEESLEGATMAIMCITKDQNYECMADMTPGNVNLISNNRSSQDQTHRSSISKIYAPKIISPQSIRFKLIEP